MATPPDSPGPEDVLFEFESARARQQTHRPVALEELLRQTKFSRHEIRVMYRGFKQECPEGLVHEESFKDIYAKFFPHGNAAPYAHYVFKAFDVNCSGAISFRDLLVTLSTLLRGSIYEKLRWTFKLYDINGDGCITRGELGEVVTAVHDLMGRKHRETEERQAREQLDRVFRKLDLNQDGVITIEEFMESCLKDEVITRSLAMFDGDL
ncbi:Kv channel-interacting protein 1 [Copidosoma floridanum]|uniref:Kv channel-interacting protein 1 n=1 Tax=Copidosoma floridanum TaxID=29053 RepID=UPI0006C98D1D|nr:Kv channel-interacting protein 1 [Copidosoma floridanum]XP_014213047.1 Kv channel-interacting protein 1 [Copidosoma floridanum]XP_014213048.1 Kv channel-interacting protein 1 [Copidosoma floridanum]